MEHLRPKLGNQGLIAASLHLTGRLKVIIVPLMIIEVFLMCSNVVGSFDFPWQLAEGDYILDHGHSTRSVLQAYGEVSPNFQNEYIVYEVIVAAVSRLFGWVGLSLFFSLICFLIYTPALFAFWRSRGNFVLIDLCLFLLAQFMINFRLAARPELVADVCYVLVGLMLMRWPGRSWTGWQTLAFGLVFCLWANAHGSFLLGGAMLALWYGQLFLFHGTSLFFGRNFTWLRPGLAALIGCALNPFGFFRFEQPFVLHSLLWGQGTSLEMWPVTLLVALLPLTWTIAAILALLLRVRERPYYWMMAMLLLLQYLTFISVRYIIFIGLSLLIVSCEGVLHPRKPFSPPIFPLAFAVARLSFYFYVTLSLLYTIPTQFYAKAAMFQDFSQSIYPKTRIATNSSFTWLREHPAQDYFLYSTISAGSWSQMPGLTGIHSLMDTGTHRYSDRVNQFYYYTLFSPETFRLVLAQLHVNAIAISSTNSYWAPLLNGNPDWHLVQIESDAQLYLRANKSDGDADKQTFLKWDDEAQRKLTDPTNISSDRILRGLKLRPDSDSLNLLLKTSDVSWLADPQVVYLKEWLGQVPDDLITETLQKAGDKMDTSSASVRLLLLLRLQRYPQAVELANKWHPPFLGVGSQDLEMLRAEAFIRGGDLPAARRILESLWPRPRYSLRWARLCQQVYALDPKAMPENARLLTDLADLTTWRLELIAALNENILRLGASQP